MNEQEVKQKAPAAQNEFRFLLKYLITALEMLTQISKHPDQPLDPAVLKRIITNVQDAFINVDTLRVFTADVCALVAELETRRPSLQAAYISGWNAHLRDLLSQLPGDEYADVRRLIEQIARDEGYTPPPKAK